MSFSQSLAIVVFPHATQNTISDIMVFEHVPDFFKILFVVILVSAEGLEVYQTCVPVCLNTLYPSSTTHKGLKRKDTPIPCRAPAVIFLEMGKRRHRASEKCAQSFWRFRMLPSQSHTQKFVDNSQRSGVYYLPFGQKDPVVIRSQDVLQELSEAPELSQRAVYADVCSNNQSHDPPLTPSRCSGASTT